MIVDKVEQQGASPVVYSARGTHASMLRAGELISDRPFLPDHNNGKGPRVLLDLIPLSEAQTPWAFWPGRWGGTRPEDQILGDVGVEANSPAPPSQHKAWSDPAGFHNDCEPADVPPVGTAHQVDRPAPPNPSSRSSSTQHATPSMCATTSPPRPMPPRRRSSCSASVLPTVSCRRPPRSSI